MSRVFAKLLITFLVLPSLALLGALPVMAQSGDYVFLVGSGFLCELESSACPAVAKSAQGDSYEISGVGTLNTKSKSVTATGTFTHKSSEGEAVGTGIWIATELLSFEPYGLAPRALAHAGRAFGSSPAGPRQLPMLAGPTPAGGLAVFSIRLVPLSGPLRTATLQVNCALGKVPDEHQTDGIRLGFAAGGVEFDQELGGRAMFLFARP